jgi:hypothetical protein
MEDAFAEKAYLISDSDVTKFDPWTLTGQIWHVIFFSGWVAHAYRGIDGMRLRSI